MLMKIFFTITAMLLLNLPQHSFGQRVTANLDQPPLRCIAHAVHIAMNKTSVNLNPNPAKANVLSLATKVLTVSAPAFQERHARPGMFGRSYWYSKDWWRSYQTDNSPRKEWVQFFSEVMEQTSDLISKWGPKDSVGDLTIVDMTVNRDINRVYVDINPVQLSQTGEEVHGTALVEVSINKSDAKELNNVTCEMQEIDLENDTGKTIYQID
jgi:hypothetical protein